MICSVIILGKPITIRFDGGTKDIEDYIKDTYRNIRSKILIETQTNDRITYRDINLYLCRHFNNGTKTDIKLPEERKLEKVIALYDQPKEKERIVSIIDEYKEKGKISRLDGAELMNLSWDLMPESDGISRDTERVILILEVKYLKTLDQKVLEPKIPERVLVYKYICNECEKIHYSGGAQYHDHLIHAKNEPILRSEGFPEIKEVPLTTYLPYYCSKCKKNHKKGKLFDTHREFEEVKS